mmetsp:Transcript_82617/g.191960  ORF Transcript_82617/g.191960 Transcript_82617/m.191960 type:complete len:140 (-) Transcript_82617:187-606(-)
MLGGLPGVASEESAPLGGVATPLGVASEWMRKYAQCAQNSWPLSETSTRGEVDPAALGVPKSGRRSGGVLQSLSVEAANGAVLGVLTTSSDLGVDATTSLQAADEMAGKGWCIGTGCTGTGCTGTPQGSSCGPGLCKLQ